MNAHRDPMLMAKADTRGDAEKAQGRDRLIAEAERRKAEREQADAARETPDFETAVEALKSTVQNAKTATAEEARAHLLRTSIFPRLKPCGWEDRFFREHSGDWGCAEQLAKFARCKQLFIGNGAIVALVGPRGVGKTTIGFQLALDRLAADWMRMMDREVLGVTLRLTPYVKLSDLFARFKALYSNFGSVDTERLIASRERFCRDDSLVVIDEVHDLASARGDGRDSLDAVPRLLTDLLDRRYAAKRDTLLVTNQTAQEFADTIGDSIYSRLTEHGAILRCEWASWRDKSSPR